MYKFIALLSAICFAYSVYGLIDLGTSYIFQGAGLIPHLAFPAALLCLVLTITLVIHVLRLRNPSHV
jgi:uncharacterized membrane protein